MSFFRSAVPAVSRALGSRVATAPLTAALVRSAAIAHPSAFARAVPSAVAGIRFYSDNAGRFSSSGEVREFEPSNRLFVANLPQGTTSENLVEIFADLGATDAVVPISFNNGQPRHFGFVTFASTEAATEALNNIPSVGEPALVASYAGPQLSQEKLDARREERRARDYPPSRDLYLRIGNVGTGEIEAAINEVVGDRPYRLTRGYDRDSGELHTFAFIRTSNVEEATEILQLLQEAQLEFNGRKLVVDFPRSREARERRRTNSGFGRD